MPCSSVSSSTFTKIITSTPSSPFHLSTNISLNFHTHCLRTKDPQQYYYWIPFPWWSFHCPIFSLLLFIKVQDILSITKVKPTTLPTYIIIFNYSIYTVYEINMYHTLKFSSSVWHTISLFGKLFSFYIYFLFFLFFSGQTKLTAA